MAPHEGWTRQNRVGSTSVRSQARLRLLWQRNGFKSCYKGEITIEEVFEMCAQGSRD